MGTDTVHAEGQPPHWSVLSLISFRFAFTYFTLLAFACLSFVVSLSGYFLLDKLLPGLLDPFWRVTIAWVGKYILHLPKAVLYQPFTSGDSLSDFIQVLIELLLAAIVTVIWSLLDRRRENYARLYQWLRLMLQLALAATLFSYGFDKVFPSQFGRLTASRLALRVGDLTPFSLLWAFMAASKPYTILSGALEVLAGLLLLVPRLTSVGAMLTIIVMSNVFALNVFYDVTVKLFSFQLLLLAMFLAAPEFPRLFKMLVLNRPVMPVHPLPVAPVARYAQSLLGLSFLAVSFACGFKGYEKRFANLTAVPFQGMWKVVEFSISGDPQSPLLTKKLADEMKIKPGEDQWKTVVFENRKSLEIQLANGEFDHVDLAWDKDTTRLHLTDSDDAGWKVNLAVQRQSDKLLNLKGTINGVEAALKLHLEDTPFNLTKGDFHIIREY